VDADEGIQYFDLQFTHWTKLRNCSWSQSKAGYTCSRVSKYKYFNLQNATTTYTLQLPKSHQH
jgi:hypothetical protein